MSEIRESVSEEVRKWLICRAQILKTYHFLLPSHTACMAHFIPSLHCPAYVSPSSTTTTTSSSSSPHAIHAPPSSAPFPPCPDPLFQLRVSPAHKGHPHQHLSRARCLPQAVHTGKESLFITHRQGSTIYYSQARKYY